MTEVISSFNNRKVDLEDMMNIGEGWKPHVRSLVDDLYALGWSGHVAQIKEKFGGLRFYADNLPESGQDLIDELEQRSRSICETCGEPGYPRGGGWILTLCDNCFKEDRGEFPS